MDAKEADDGDLFLSLLISHKDGSGKGFEGWGRQRMDLHSLTMEIMKSF